MVEVRIPFNLMFRDAMLEGRKSCTSRTKRYGNVGDTFSAFDCTFRIGAIQKRTLQYVAKELWSLEGANGPSSFVGLWVMLHPGRKWQPEQVVWVHHFALIRSPKVM